ncbi:ubiquitin carboxyl-terminal hydrolase 40 isoform X1 [Petromyzon marinus]|uniref:ubiquitin carboxyl-terminal hydrolase 40 isoform X1 n=2 Tax=Petromyzon marinus TaxID=7757 RepID=UPI003F6EA8E6
MFGDLFVEDAGPDSGGNSSSGRRPAAARNLPPAPRELTCLCGIQNLGATCYLNSLLQTLFHTPEMREAIFSLKPEELGDLADKDKPGAKVRVIPLQLQRLFAQLLLLDQQAVSTAALTDSFGWTHTEEGHQHDVQELSRILFGALECSLVGTMGHDLISRLYHGTVVNQITCRDCGRRNEREETFQDLTMAVHGNRGLEEALSSYYCESEEMEGDNRYCCDECARLVCATKSAKLRTLPTILTFSLLRFSFDFVKCERYKETGRFTFPRLLDMRPYCEMGLLGREDCMYELFSVIVHKGGCHGGHYHALICDVSHLGVWTGLIDEEPKVENGSAHGQDECPDPVEACRSILNEAGNCGLSLDVLCRRLQEKTGTSWNKGHRARYGPVTKFLKSHANIFDYNAAKNWVSLSTGVASTSFPVSGDAERSTSNGCAAVNEEGNERACAKSADSALEAPHVTSKGDADADGSFNMEERQWFDFDDSRVQPVREQELAQQFEGRESAYMLFYRPRRAKKKWSSEIPQWLVDEVTILNTELIALRKQHEQQLHNLTLHLHLSPLYAWDAEAGALRPASPHGDPALPLCTDARVGVTQLRSEIEQLLESWEGPLAMSLAKLLPAGLHIYEPLQDGDRSLSEAGLKDGCNLFIWDGNQVGGVPIATGKENEPVLLDLVVSGAAEADGPRGPSSCAGGSQPRVGLDSSPSWQRGFPKALLLGGLRSALAAETGIPAQTLGLALSQGGRSVWLEREREDSVTVGSLGVVDGDQLMLFRECTQDACQSGLKLENPSDKGQQSSVTPSLRLNIKSGLLDECGAQKSSTVELTCPVDTVVSTIKSLVLEKMHLEAEAADGYCLRMADSTGRLLSPMREDAMLCDAGLQQDALLTLCSGRAPTSGELFLSFTVSGGPDSLELDFVVPQTSTIRECLKLVLNKANVSAGDWHLRRVNWCGDVGEPLYNQDATLQEQGVQGGDVLQLTEGPPPTKGLLTLSVWLLKPATGFLAVERGAREGPDAGKDGTKRLSHIGEVHISGIAFLDDLRAKVLSLGAVQPEAAALTLSPRCVRVRLLEEGLKPGKILRNGQQQLRNLGLRGTSQLCVQILPQEEVLGPFDLLLQLQLRVPGERRYRPPREMILDTTQGCTVTSLRNAVAQTLQIPAQQLELAKRFPDTSKWVCIWETTSKGGKGKRRQNRENLRQSPFFLHDGDTIGVKDLSVDSSPDFSTAEDDEQNLRLQMEKKQKDGKSQKLAGDGAATARPRRAEVALSISVADYR